MPKRNNSWPRPRKGEARTLQSEFPGATHWGVVGSMGGSWANKEDFVCEACGSSNELVVFYGSGSDLRIGHRECFRCWHQGLTQLTLDLEAS